mgnify:CR=1 FL=1
MERKLKFYVLAIAVLIGTVFSVGSVKAQENIAGLATPFGDAANVSALNDGVIGSWGAWQYDSYSGSARGVEPHRLGLVWEDDPVTINKVVMYHANVDVPNYVLKDYQIQTLKADGNPTDDADWETQVTVTNNALVVTEHLFNAVTTTGLRIFVTDACRADNNTRLQELEVYAAPPSPPGVLTKEEVMELIEDALAPIIAAIDLNKDGILSEIGDNGYDINTIINTYNTHTHDKGSGGRNTSIPAQQIQ